MNLTTKSNKKLSGIYKITNILNNKFYIGSAINFSKRWKRHRQDFNRGEHSSIYFQRSWDKHGLRNFKFEIIEIIDDQTKLIEREQYFLDTLTPWKSNIGYNISPTAGSSLGVKRSVEYKRRVSEKLKGRKLTKEHCINIGIASKLRGGNPIVSQKRCKSLRARKVRKFSLDEIFIEEFGCIKDAADSVNAKTHSNISSCCSGKYKSVYGFIWKYSSDQ